MTRGVSFAQRTRERRVWGRGSARLRLLLRSVAAVVTAATAAGWPLVTQAAEDAATPVGPRPLSVVFEGVVRGDVVVAGNSNLRSAGGWDVPGGSVADVDRDRTVLCAGRGEFAAVCADNSSWARLDVPAGARVVRARLYVESSLSASAGPLRVRVAAPGSERSYWLAGADTPKIPKLFEAESAISARAVLRQAVWDLTWFLRANGGGRYTVADIVSERAGPYLPYASWAIVAVYEPAPDLDVDTMTPRQRARFAPRMVSWHDGFVLAGEAAPATAELAVPAGGVEFAKSLHVVANARRGEADNLLFNGRPLGNNRTPGDRPSPPGVRVGHNRRCNTTTDVLNESICVLGRPVATKRPGRAGYLASSDGTTRSSGSAVDIDVIRIPDQYLVAGGPTSTLEIDAVGDDPLAVGVLALSADLPLRSR